MGAAAIHCCVRIESQDSLSRRERLEATTSSSDAYPDVQFTVNSQDSSDGSGKAIALLLAASPPAVQVKSPEKPIVEDEAGLSPNSSAVLAKMRENVTLPAEAANDTVLSRHKAFQERKRLKQEKRKLRAKRGNSLRDGFLSNVPEVEADVQYRFNFIVMGIASDSVISIVCGSEEAKQMELRMNGHGQLARHETLESDENLASMDSMQSFAADNSPHRRFRHVGTSGSVASDLNTIEAEMALQSEEQFEDPDPVSERDFHASEHSNVPQDQGIMGSERSLLSSVNSAQEFVNSAQELVFEGVNSVASAVSFDGSTSLSPSQDAADLTQAIGGSQRSLQSGGNSRLSLDSNRNRCLCPVPYPWGRTHNQDRVKLAKLVFTARSFSEAIMPCETRLEAASTSLVIALVVDPADSEPSFEAQLYSLVEAIEESGYTRPHLRPARAVLLMQRSQNQQVQGNWESHLQVFEKAYGALWRFGPAKVDQANDLYAVFAKIASQRIYQAQNNQTEHGSDEWSDEEDDDEWAENMKVGYKSERGGRTPSELMALSSAQDATPAPKKKLLSTMYNSLRGKG
mmetsp:Transcript_25621/g.59205  ORF Transcript_25621/g.59205 Transcript_25621/m.59205 type:complete len:572 (+) Transcript_25621:124-1839(+)